MHNSFLLWTFFPCREHAPCALGTELLTEGQKSKGIEISSPFGQDTPGPKVRPGPLLTRHLRLHHSVSPERGAPCSGYYGTMGFNPKRSQKADGDGSLASKPTGCLIGKRKKNQLSPLVPSCLCSYWKPKTKQRDLHHAQGAMFNSCCIRRKKQSLVQSQIWKTALLREKFTVYELQVQKA